MKTIKTNVNYAKLYHDLINRILKGKGYSSSEERLAAFSNAHVPQPLGDLIDKVAHNAYKITDSDMEAVKKTGVSEDQLFEFVVCAAVGQASRQYENGLAALAQAKNEGGIHAS